MQRRYQRGRNRRRRRMQRRTTRSSTNKRRMHRGRRDLLNDQQRRRPGRHVDQQQRARCLLDTGGDLDDLGHLGGTISGSTPAGYPP